MHTEQNRSLRGISGRLTDSSRRWALRSADSLVHDCSVTVRPEIDIREVGSNCGDLLAVRRLWFPGADHDFERRFIEWWAQERDRRYAVVAYSDGEPVGMANAQIFTRMPVPGRSSGRWMYAANVYVAETQRRSGLGRSLMQALIEYAKLHRMARIVLAPSDMSIPFYRALGFRPAQDLMRLDLTTTATQSPT